MFNKVTADTRTTQEVRLSGLLTPYSTRIAILFQQIQGLKQNPHISLDIHREMTEPLFRQMLLETLAKLLLLNKELSDEQLSKAIHLQLSAITNVHRIDLAGKASHTINFEPMIRMSIMPQGVNPLLRKIQ